MRLAFFPAPPVTARLPLRQRATSLVLAVAATLLIIVAMLSLNGATPQPPRFRGSPIMIDLKPDADRTDVTRRAVSKPESEPKRPAPPSRPIPIPKPVQPPVPNPYYIPLTREENAAADISKLRHADGGQGIQQASAAGDSRPVGTAPDGEPLYEAQWYRRPTNAELDFYLPAHRPIEGWGLIACRTIAHYHVDDCVELGSSPGSHLAGAVRQSAWQFLVRPPRLGGRELVGTWVRIRIDYVQTVSEPAVEP